MSGSGSESRRPFGNELAVAASWDTSSSSKTPPILRPPYAYHKKTLLTVALFTHLQHLKRLQLLLVCRTCSSGHIRRHCRLAAATRFQPAIQSVLPQAVRGDCDGLKQSLQYDTCDSSKDPGQVPPTPTSTLINKTNTNGSVILLCCTMFRP